MEIVDKKLNTDERKLLESLKGCKLEAIQGAFLFGDTEAWNTVRLNMSEFCTDINLFRESIPMDDEGSLDETGIFSITNAPMEKLCVTAISEDVTTKKISKIITGIRVYESEVKYFENGNQYFQNNITKAIAFKFDNEWMVFDRQVWFEESITITFCCDVLDGVKDDKEDWEVGKDDENNDGVLTMEYKLISYDI